MSYSIQIDHEHQIIDYRHVGIIGTDEIGKAWQEFLKLKEFTELQYNLMSDYSEAQFDMDLEDVERITQFLLSLKGILEEKKQALIVNKPFDTVISDLFEGEANKRIGFRVAVFSTRNAARHWVSKIGMHPGTHKPIP
jgi:hypothetical protein